MTSRKVEQKTLKDILYRLISFRTETSDQKEVFRALRYIDSLFSKDNFESEMIEHEGIHSLLVRFKGCSRRNPALLLNGHIDVVSAANPGQYKPYEKDGKIFGRGAADMKSGIAAMIGAMLEYGHKGKELDVALLITGDEEVGGSRGTGYIVRELGLVPGFVLVGDGPRQDRIAITIKEKGGSWIELKSRGTSAHGARPWLGINAIDTLLEAIAEIKKWIGPAQAEAWKSTCNVAIVETSNETPNIVPGDARAVLDIRFTESLASSPDELLNKISKLVPGVEVSALTKIPLLLNDEQEPLIQKLQQAAKDIIGKEVHFVYGHGASDARYFREKGTPAVLIGTVGGNWHGAEEWVDTESMSMVKDILVRFLENFSTQTKLGLKKQALTSTTKVQKISKNKITSKKDLFDASSRKLSIIAGILSLILIKIRGVSCWT